MEAAHESFFHDAISHETNESLADAVVEMPESREEEYHVPTELSGSNTAAEPTNAIIEPTETLDRSDPPQALVIFVLGEHRFSDSCELGVMNEHPEALQAITSNQCLSTSAFLKPALHAAMAELRPSIMVQVAVRLTAITLRLAAKILRTEDGMAQYPDVCENEQQELSETIRTDLERAVPYYQWQGPSNYYGRVQYLMALLQEAIGAFTVPTSSLAEALKQDVQANQAAKRVARSVFDLGDTLSDVCGPWAAEHLLSSWENSSFKTPFDRNANAEEESVNDATKPRKLSSCMTPKSDLEEELPSPSTFIRKKPIRRNSQTAMAAEVRLPEAVNNDAAKQGSRADDPMCISDSEAEDARRPVSKLDRKKSDLKAARHSCRGEALKDVDYSTRHHPQDKDIPGFRERRTTQIEEGNAAARTWLAKRRKIVDSGSCS